MITAATANTNALNARANLTYIETLVTNASNQGKFNVIVDGFYMDDDMATELRNDYNFFVTKDPTSTFPLYKISWQ